MSDTMTVKDLLWLLAGIITIITFINTVKKPFDSINTSLKSIQKTTEDNKNDIADLKEDFKSIQKDITNHGDMIYQMLDHLATNNNSGNMKRCLDSYNEYNRHN